MNTPNEPENAVMLISYKTLRTLVGVLGMLLSTILVIGMYVLSTEDPVQKSISHFYHTRMGDVFVGLLTAISLFLLVYKGPERKDHWLGNIAGILGMIVAFFPCAYDASIIAYPPGDGSIMDRSLHGDVNQFHLYSAGAFLLVLATFSLWLFPKTRKGATVQRGTRKYWRNIVYYAAGIIMIGCVAFLAYQFWFNENAVKTTKITFIMETVALLAFGISWLVKGGQIVWFMNDKVPVAQNQNAVAAN